MKSRLSPKTLALPAAAIFLACSLSASAADRWWDATNTGGTGDGAATAGTAAWDLATPNWDQGAGLDRVAWDNTSYDTAIFTGGNTITLGSGVTAKGLIATGTTTIRGNQTLTLQTAASPTGAMPTIFNSGSLVIGASGNSTVLAGTEGLLKSGAGLLTLRGSAAHTLTGGLTINGAAGAPSSTASGRVEVDFVDMAANSSNLFNSDNLLTIGSGYFSVKGKSSGGTLTQTLNGLNLTGGQAGIIVNLNSSTSTILDLRGSTGDQVITRAPGAALHVVSTSATAGLVKTASDNDTTGILGPWATVFGTATSSFYATVDGSDNIVTYTGGTTATDAAGLTTTGGSTNYNLSAATGTMVSNAAANTIRFTGAAATTTVTSLTTNGLLNGGTAIWTLNGGIITIGASKELVINTANSNNIIIGSVIQDYGTGGTPEASALTIAGYKQVTLSGANTYTGATTINGTSAVGDGAATMVVSALKNSGVATEFGAGTNVVLNGAVIQTGATGTSNRDISISGNSGFYVKGAFAQTLTGSISGSGSLTTDGDYVDVNTPGGSGNLVLAGDNSFTGDMRFKNDSRVTLKHVNALKNATLDMTGTRILADLTTHDLNYVIGGLKGSVGIDIGNGIVSIGNNNQSNVYSGVLSGAGNLNKIGTGTQTLTAAQIYSGPTTVSNGTLALSGSGALPTNTTIEVQPGAILDVTALSGGMVIDSTQTLIGEGTVNGDITVAGTLAPGASPGILTVNGNLTLGGTLSLELGGISPGAGGHDQVALNGGGVLGGTLSLAWNLFSAPAAGTELVLIDNDGTDLFTGTFSNAADDSPWTDNLGGTWNLNYAGGTGNDLTLVAAGATTIPEPSAALLGGLGLLALLRRRRN